MDEITFNPFPNKPWFLRVCSTSLLKTLLEKEKLFLTSNFSFSCSVFYPIWELSSVFIKFEIVVYKPFQFESVSNLLFGKGLKRRNRPFNASFSPTFVRPGLMCWLLIYFFLLIKFNEYIEICNLSKM